MTSKKPSSPVLAFRLSKTTTALPDRLATNDYLIPKVVKDLGQLIGLKADKVFANWMDGTYQTELEDAYQELAATTAILLDFYSVDDISDEAVHSVSHRLASTVNPLVSLNARVDHLFRAYAQDELESLRDDAQKLWAALEFRCEAITGKTFAQVLGQ